MAKFDPLLGKLVSHKHTESDLTISDTAINNVSINKHGFVPKITDTTKFLKGDGTWATPTASVNSGDIMLQSQVFS